MKKTILIFIVVLFSATFVLADNFATGEKIDLGSEGLVEEAGVVGEQVEMENQIVTLKVSSDYGESCSAGFQTIPEKLEEYFNPKVWRDKNMPALEQEFEIEVTYQGKCDLVLIINDVPGVIESEFEKIKLLDELAIKLRKDAFVLIGKEVLYAVDTERVFKKVKLRILVK